VVVAALLVAGGLCLVQTLSAHHTVFLPGTVWVDTHGNPINAHGGGILYHQGTYYWFGEIKTDPTWRVPSVTSWDAYRVQAGGVSCYTSPDLLHWTYAGVALPPHPLDRTHDLHPSKVMERPKVLYNAKTAQFVMWLHVDTEDYSYAHSSVAVSQAPCGPYQYLRSVKPNGHEARDMTVYQDEDGTAYHIYAAEQQTLRIALLAEDYIAHTPYDRRIAGGTCREAPAMFKYRRKYHLITSACTGWEPNEASYVVADHPLGKWQDAGPPCIGAGARTTFHAQGTYVLPVQGIQNTFIFMADRWNPVNLADSRYVWLPFSVRRGKPQIAWRDIWELAVLTQQHQ
jgi:hypothetical protein